MLFVLAKVSMIQQMQNEDYLIKIYHFVEIPYQKYVLNQERDRGGKKFSKNTETLKAISLSPEEILI